MKFAVRNFRDVGRFPSEREKGVRGLGGGDWGRRGGQRGAAFNLGSEAAKGDFLEVWWGEELWQTLGVLVCWHQPPCVTGKEN